MISSRRPEVWAPSLGAAPRLDLFGDDRLSGEKVRSLPRGSLVVGIGMPRPGVAEVLVPSAGTFARTYFANYRFPAEDAGLRWMQRLPAMAHKEDRHEERGP